MVGQYQKVTRVQSYRAKLQVRTFNDAVRKQFACTGARIRLRLTLFNELQRMGGNMERKSI